MSTDAVRLEDVHKSFGRLEVLKGIDLDLGRHEVVALIGAAAVAFRHRRAATTAPPLVAVTERQFLGKETGVAVLAAEGRRLLVGYGPAGVALLTELGPPLGPPKERLP